MKWSLITTITLVLSLLGSGSVAAQDESSWEGVLDVNYSPTSISGTMNLSIQAPDREGLSVHCVSDRHSLTPCTITVWGNFNTPPESARHVVVGLYAGTDLMAEKVFSRNDLAHRNGFWVFTWEENLFNSDFLNMLVDGRPITVMLSDANGLGNAISYDTSVYGVSPLPARAIDIIRRIRSVDDPRQIALAVLGRRCFYSRPSTGEVQVMFSDDFETPHCQVG